jgi:hypothetical protein
VALLLIFALSSHTTFSQTQTGATVPLSKKKNLGGDLCYHNKYTKTYIMGFGAKVTIQLYSIFSHFVSL